jgi:choline dehydrogenase-like flavoprotein
MHRNSADSCVAGRRHSCGGGSLVYANTLYEPKSDAFYRDPHWADITDWKAELTPFYDQAKRMLGVAKNPTMTRSDRAMLAVAEQMGVKDTFGMTPVGECMTGCRHNAKNTLVKNYLYLAERAGATIHEHTRPALGADYQRIRPVEPLKPVVPAHAPAALRLQ